MLLNTLVWATDSISYFLTSTAIETAQIAVNPTNVGIAATDPVANTCGALSSMSLASTSLKYSTSMARLPLDSELLFRTLNHFRGDLQISGDSPATYKIWCRDMADSESPAIDTCSIAALHRSR